MNASGEAVRGLVKSRGNFTRGFTARKFLPGFAREKYGGLARSRIPPATQAKICRVHKQIFNSPLNLNLPSCFFVRDCTLLSAEAELKTLLNTQGSSMATIFEGIRNNILIKLVVNVQT